MLEELLLQFFICLLPVFAYQLWNDMEHRFQNHKRYLIVVCGVSIVLCKLTAMDSNSLQFNYQIIPYITGAIYGGMPAFIILSLVFAASHIGSFDHAEYYLLLLLYMGTAGIFIRFACNALKEVSYSRKVRRYMLSSVGILILTLLFLTLDPTWKTWDWSLISILQMIMFVGLFLVAVWYIFIRSEAIAKKKVVSAEYKQLYTDYNSEVEKLQQFINRSIFGVIIVDADGHITQINNNIVSALNVNAHLASLDQLLGSNYKLLFQNAKGKFGESLLDEALIGNSTSLFQARLDQEYFLCTSLTLYDIHKKEISGAALIVQNITELAHLRDEVGRMDRLSIVGQMAASITHEIRNPLAVIRGFIQLLQERTTGGEQEYFRIVMEELDRANLIISDFLSLAQNREVKKELCSLNLIISDLMPLLKADANLRGQTLHLKLEESLPSLYLNEREIKQMLLNLIRNGMEAMEDKGSLRICTYSAGEFVHLEIRDEGVGIPQDVIKRLFEPFFTTRSRGTGLGLPLCLSIAEKHNGTIFVESEEGKGTTFTVKLKCAEV